MLIYSLHVSHLAIAVSKLDLARALVGQGNGPITPSLPCKVSVTRKTLRINTAEDHNVGFIFATLLNTPQSKVRAPALVFTNPLLNLYCLYFPSIQLIYCTVNDLAHNLIYFYIIRSLFLRHFP